MAQRVENLTSGSSRCGTAGMNPITIHEDGDWVHGLARWGLWRGPELWCRLQMRLGY